jgi:hypothetical protein
MGGPLFVLNKEIDKLIRHCIGRHGEIDSSKVVMQTSMLCQLLIPLLRGKIHAKAA